MANYTAVAAGGAWNVSTTWSPAGVPGAADTAILNSSSGNVTVPAAGATCATLTLTGYTGTLLLNGNLTIVTSGLNLGSFTGIINFSAGDIILPDGLFNLGNASVYTTLGTGGVLITKPSASFSIFNTNNKIWNCKFALGATGSTSPTIYFEDNPLEVTGLVSFQASTTGTINLISADIFTPNLIFLKISGDFTLTGSTIYTTTTSGQNLGITGSGNQTLTGSGTYQLRSSLRIDKTGGILSLVGTLRFNTGTLTYVASGGTVNAGTSTLYISGASTTLNTNGITWYDLSVVSTVSITITLSSTLSINNSFNVQNVNGNLGTITFSGSSVTTTSSTVLNFGNDHYAVSTGSNTITFPASTTLNCSNLNLQIGGVSTTAFNLTINNATINVYGNLTMNWTNQTLGTFLGTTSLIKMVGTGIISMIGSGAGNQAHLRIPLTIDTTGIVTFSGNIYYNTGTITYVPNTGSVDTSSSTLVSALSTTFATNGMIWNNVTFSGTSQVFTFSNDFTVAGTLSLSGTTGMTLTSNNIFITGNLSITTPTPISGTTLITFNGTGSQSWTHTAAGYLGTSVTINKASGVLTLGTAIYYQTGALTFIASGGTVDTTTNSNTLVIGATCSLATNGISWNNVTLSFGIIALTLTNDFNIAGTFSATGLGGTLTLTFGGSGIFNPTGPFITNNAGATGIATITITLPNDISVASFTYNDNSGSANRRNVTLNGSRNITVNGAVYFGNTRTSTISGTCTIIFVGNANFTMGTVGGSAAGIYSIPIKIDSGLNTCTFIGNPVFTSTTITYTSGIITGASCIFSACTLNLNSGGQWGTDVTLRGATTLTSNATFGNLTTATIAVSFTGAFTINVKGNLTINIATSGASTPIVINGTGNQSWTHGSAVYLSNNLTINKSSATLTLGPTVYYQSGILTHISGDVDALTNSNTLNIGLACSLNTSNINWNIITTTQDVTSFNTLLSDLYCKTITILYYGLGAFQFGLSGNFKLICDTLNVSSNITVTGTFIVPSNNIYTNNLTLNGRASGGGKINCTGGKFYVNGNLTVATTGGINTNQYGYYGSEIIMTGSGNLYTNFGISNPLTFDTSGTIRVTSTYFYYGSIEVGTSNPIIFNLKYLRGNIKAENSILYLGAAGFNGSGNPYFYELTNINKIVFKEVFIASSRAGIANDIYMNEFFNGSPTVKTKIQAITAGINYIVNFTDNFEKIAKFVNISGCTLSRPQQLLVITDSKKSSTNTRGIRYINSLPNGIAKGDPSIQNILTPGQSSNLLIADPAFVKTI